MMLEHLHNRSLTAASLLQTQLVDKLLSPGMWIIGMLAFDTCHSCVHAGMG